MVQRDRANSLLGLILIIAGVVLLIGTLGWADVGDWYKWLPAVLIVVGAYQLYVNRFEAYLGPVLLMAIGAALLMATLGVIKWSTFGALWPIILVVFGLSILLRRGRQPETSADATSDRLNVVAFLGESKRRMVSQTFRGGDITAFMGSVELDFREAAVADPPAKLNVNTMMGGVDLRVPDSWVVDMRVSALLGGVEDQRKGRLASQPGAPHLIITGLAIMGGVTIKS